MVGAGEGDLKSLLVQEEGACELESVGASKRMTITQPRYESEELGPDRYLHESLPIVSKAKPELLKLRSA